MDKFFLPLQLTTARIDKKNILDFYHDIIIDGLLGKNGITVFQIPFKITDTVNQTNEFLKKIDCMVGHYGLFCTPENTEDTMVHVDGRKSLTSELEVLEARFSYYDILGSNGEIEWFEDIGDRYEVISIINGKTARSFQFKWVEKLKNGEVMINDCPKSMCKVRTTCNSGIVNTSVPHRVIQGTGNRVTLGFQILNFDGTTHGVWRKTNL